MGHRSFCAMNGSSKRAEPTFSSYDSLLKPSAKGLLYPHLSQAIKVVSWRLWQSSHSTLIPSFELEACWCWYLPSRPRCSASQLNWEDICWKESKGRATGSVDMEYRAWVSISMEMTHDVFYIKNVRFCMASRAVYNTAIYYHHSNNLCRYQSSNTWKFPCITLAILW